MSNHTSIQLRRSSLSFIALLGACSREVVDLGGATAGQNLERGSRCSESLIIDESVVITNQAELDALLGCEEIRGDFTVQFFADTDLSPLDSLRSVEGTFFLGAHAPTPEGLDNASLEAYFAEQQRAAEIVAAGWLPSLHGVESLERIGGLILYGIAAADLRAFESLRNLSSHYSGSFAGQINIDGLENLVDLSGLENATGVTTITLTNNPALESLQGLRVGEAIRDIFLQANPQLSNLEALSPLQSTAGMVYLEDLGIENLDAFATLGFVQGELALFNNTELENIDALSPMTYAEALVLQGNPKLASLPAFPELQQLDYFKAVNNAGLETLVLDFPSLYNLNLVNDNTVELSASVIEIGGNAALQSIDVRAGFGAAQVLAIYGNGQLASVDLGTLRRLDTLSISGNPSLTQVELGELQTVDSLSVLFNPLLSTAELAGVRTFESSFEQNADDPAL